MTGLPRGPASGQAGCVLRTPGSFRVARPVHLREGRNSRFTSAARISISINDRPHLHGNRTARVFNLPVSARLRARTPPTATQHLQELRVASSSQAPPVAPPAAPPLHNTAESQGTSPPAPPPPSARSSPARLPSPRIVITTPSTAATMPRLGHVRAPRSGVTGSCRPRPLYVDIQVHQFDPAHRRSRQPHDQHSQRIAEKSRVAVSFRNSG